MPAGNTGLLGGNSEIHRIAPPGKAQVSITTCLLFAFTIVDVFGYERPPTTLGYAELDTNNSQPGLYSYTSRVLPLVVLEYGHFWRRWTCHLLQYFFGGCSRTDKRRPPAGAAETFTTTFVHRRVISACLGLGCTILETPKSAILATRIPVCDGRARTLCRRYHGIDKTWSGHRHERAGRNFFFNLTGASLAVHRSGLQNA
jgi:hypothetical protein